MRKSKPTEYLSDPVVAANVERMIEANRNRPRERFPKKQPRIENGPSGPLTSEEETRFTELKAIVHRGKRAWYEVGCALHELRARRLYRATHRTWEAFCKEEFDFSKRYCDYQVGAVFALEHLSVAKAENESLGNLGTRVPKTPSSWLRVPDSRPPLLPLIHNERIAREFAKLHDVRLMKDAYDAFEHAAETGRNPTVVLAKECVDLVRAKHAKPIEAKPSSMPSSPTEPLTLPVAGWDLAVKALAELRKALEALSESEHGDALRTPEHDLIPGCTQSLRQIKDLLRLTRPEIVCPQCKGKTCKKCHGHGWLSKREIEK